MYTARIRSPEALRDVEHDGLGFGPLVAGIIAAIVSAAGSAAAQRLISGPSSPSQKQVEAQLKLQSQLEIRRMLEQSRIQQQQTDQIAKYALPLLGIAAVVMLLR